LLALAHDAAGTPSPASYKLAYTPPYDWATVLSFFQAHRVPHLESVDNLAYERVVRPNKGLGWFRVIEDKKRNSLQLSVWNGDEEDLTPISSAVRRMFDLDANPAVIRDAMSADSYLASVWKQHAGLRVARCWSGFETMITTVLGQLVSVNFGRTLVGELMQAAGRKARHPKTAEPIHLFPTPKRLLMADLSTIRTSESRRAAIRALASLVARGTFETHEPLPSKELRRLLLAVPGIGAWTSEYIAMRGFHDDDAFPAIDYGLKQEVKRHPEVNVNRVRPCRAYAATALWKSFAQTKGTTYESVV
jgi:DNA-3-methyladenine glycosylase II